MENQSVFKNLKWKQVRTTNYDMSFIRFIPQSDNIAESQIVLAFKPTGTEFIEPTEVLMCNISFKPLMSLVWLGVIMTTIGFIISMFNHRVKGTVSEK
jgi:hypothetical protein